MLLNLEDLLDESKNLIQTQPQDLQVLLQYMIENNIDSSIIELLKIILQNKEEVIGSTTTAYLCTL